MSVNVDVLQIHFRAVLAGASECPQELVRLILLTGIFLFN
jgi:hypothetical protein